MKAINKTSRPSYYTEQLADLIEDEGAINCKSRIIIL